MLFKEENNYLNIANRIIDEGYRSSNRTGVDTRKIHAASMSFDLRDGKVPVLSTRQIPVKSPIIELLWFISGSTNIDFLKKHNLSIWDSWVKPGTEVYDSEIDVGLRDLVKKGLIKTKSNFNAREFFMKYGPSTANQILADLTGENVPIRKLVAGSIGEGAYGAQWRKWEDVRLVPYQDEEQKNQLEKLGYKNMEHEIRSGSISEHTPELCVYRKHYDQLQNAIDLINNNPDSRRIIVSAWNPGKLDLASLAPCHNYFQFLPFEHEGEKYLDLSLSCRSQDFLVGTVFNILQYSVLCHMVAKLTGRKAHKLFWTGHDTHIYENQVAIYQEHHRERSIIDNDIQLVINDRAKDYTSIDDFIVSDLQINGYDDYLEPIKYPVAV